MLILGVIITALLYVVPYGDVIGYPFILLSTLFHELGHGLAAVAVGAEFEVFRMYPDASGIAVWRGSVGNLGRAFISAGGLVGPAIASGLLLLLARRPRVSRAGLLILGILLIWAEIAVVRNTFGLVFVACVAGVCIAVTTLTSSRVAQLFTVFLSVQLALSVFSRGDYLFTQYAMTAEGQNPSDVEHIAQALLLPYWFWGAVCGALSLMILIISGWGFLRPTNQDTQTAGIENHNTARDLS